MKEEILTPAEILRRTPPIRKAQIRTKMSIAARLDDALIAKGWTDAEFAKKMGQKNKKIIAKWLSGTHNFTLDLLVKLEQVLDVQLLITEANNKPDTRERELPPQVKKSKAS